MNRVERYGKAEKNEWRRQEMWDEERCGRRQQAVRALHMSTWNWGSGSHHEITERRRGVTVLSCPAQVTHTFQLITAHLQQEEKQTVCPITARFQIYTSKPCCICALWLRLAWYQFMLIIRNKNKQKAKLIAYLVSNIIVSKLSQANSMLHYVPTWANYSFSTSWSEIFDIRTSQTDIMAIKLH